MSTDNLEGLAAVLSGSGVDLPIHDLTKTLPNAHVLHRPIDIWRACLADQLSRLSGCTSEIAFDAIQTPNTLVNGDLNMAVPRLRIKGKKPDELCAECAAGFPGDHPLVAKPAPAGIHLPFFFTPRPLPRLIIPYIFHRGSSYGNDHAHGLRHVDSASQPQPASASSATATISASSGSKADRKRVIIEFSSPNIAKEFHAGHLRSTIIGAFLSNLYEGMGWDVVKINYLGDWGKQFGLLAVGWERFGSEEELAREPLKHLLDIYARINSMFKPEQDASKKARDEGRDTAEIESQGLFAERNAFFRRMEDGELTALALWRRFRDLSIERYVSTYARLGIDFDEYSGESQVQTATVDFVEQQLREKGVYYEENGSWMIDFTKHGGKGLGVAVVRGRTGTTTYLLRDVAAVIEREKKYAFDNMIYVVSSEQDQYFKRVFKTLELTGRGDLAARLQHVSFGKVMGMSSRLGNVKLLGDILDQSSSAMHEVMRRNETKYSQIPNPDAVAESVGIAAVMVQDMTGKRINNYPFDMARMTSFEGDTGPYLQYCHARLNSILRKAEIDRADLVDHMVHHPAALDEDVVEKKQGMDLLRLMAQFPDVTATALRNLEPSTILTYLFRLTHQISSCYNVIQVIGTDVSREVVLARACLYEASRQVLENGMRLLGLQPVERM